MAKKKEIDPKVKLIKLDYLNGIKNLRFLANKYEKTLNQILTILKK